MFSCTALRPCWKPFWARRFSLDLNPCISICRVQNCKKWLFSLLLFPVSISSLVTATESIPRYLPGNPGSFLSPEEKPFRADQCVATPPRGRWLLPWDMAVDAQTGALCNAPRDRSDSSMWLMKGFPKWLFISQSGFSSSLMSIKSAQSIKNTLCFLMHNRPLLQLAPRWLLGLNHFLIINKSEHVTPL